MTSTNIADAELAAAVASSLCASGIGALPDVDDDGTVWLALGLDEHTVAWLDVADLSYAVLVRRDGTKRLIPDGPLAGLERCSDPRCVSSHVLSFVLSIRCGAHR
ncbi:hypothetical protein [Cellulomonas uda]|uniref:Uncharacterized protein n=1 Tax=Cellulomonas uda TaxID=1714 RepID=A0A4Y3KFB7_CELUD|nr:hypothetical protein [Cellulomonas uda]NII67845.1 hypothetical protein [Cellulomonas uda]GEA82366.1 hypothetical protein CUD01_28100 [Cellulomonas uda]